LLLFCRVQLRQKEADARHALRLFCMQSVLITSLRHHYYTGDNINKSLIALMMEAARTSETLVKFYQTTRCYNPEDSHLQ
jgi:hypothetical protein